MKTYHSFSSDETRSIGELLGKKSRNLEISKSRTALVLALQGDLGAGKTTFTQGFFKGLGIKRRAMSPTFVIMRKYRVPSDKRQGRIHFTHVWHIDAYRLKKAEDMAVLEFDAILSDPKNIVIIEWPERIREVLPKNAVWLMFGHGKKENERNIVIG